MATSQVPERGSTHTTETSRKDKQKLTRKVSAEKQVLISQTKLATSNGQGEASSSHNNNSQAIESISSAKVDEMASGLRGSREGMVFDDTFEGMILKIYINSKTL